jgi:hypothetical protein
VVVIAFSCQAQSSLYRRERYANTQSRVRNRDDQELRAKVYNASWLGARLEMTAPSLP